MKHHINRIVPILIAGSLIFSPLSSAFSATLDQKSMVVFEPSTMAPGSPFKATGSGFAPNSTVSISRKGQTFAVDLYFNEIQKKTNEMGAVIFEGNVPEMDQGSNTFDFTDEAGNTVAGTYTVEGAAPRRFIIDTQLAVLENEIQVGLTGVGWKAPSKKSVTARDPLNQPYTPPFTDLCEGVSCAERTDGLKILLSLPRSTPAGTHTFTVSEDGGSAETRIEIPKLPENEEVAKLKPVIILVNPPLGTVDVLAIRVKGKDWGNYKKRRYVQAWLVNPDNTEQAYELTVFRNYAPCSFTIGGGKIVGGCGTSELDELSLHLEIPESLKKDLAPHKYLLHVKTENGLEAAAMFQIITTPDLSKVEKPTIVVSPINRGPVGHVFVLSGGGFGSMEVLTYRFDGVKLPIGGVLQTDTKGQFDNVAFVIPSNLKIDEKFKEVLPGTHTIDISGGNGKNIHSASTPFIVERDGTEEKKDDKDKKKEDDKIEKERKEKEQIEKDKQKLDTEREKAEKEKERLDKEQKEIEKKLKEKAEKEGLEKDKDVKEKLQKEQDELSKKLKEKEKEEKKVDDKLQKIDKKEEILDKKEEKIKTNFCDPVLPITFQPGCVQLKKADEKSPYAGKLCQPDQSITFQPGCVSGQPLEQEKLFKGKTCSSDIPLVWQEGCVPIVRAVEQSPYSGKQCSADLPIVFQPGCVPVQRSEQVSQYAGQQCREDMAITFQPGCVSVQKSVVLLKPYQGKSCDPNLPLVWQEGCLQQPKIIELPKSVVGQKCNPLVPTYTQVGCIP